MDDAKQRDHRIWRHGLSDEITLYEVALKILSEGQFFDGLYALEDHA